MSTNLILLLLVTAAFTALTVTALEWRRESLSPAPEGA